MIATTITSLIILFMDYLRTSNYILMVVDVLLLILSLGVSVLVVKTFIKPLKKDGNTIKESISEPV